MYNLSTMKKLPAKAKIGRPAVGPMLSLRVPASKKQAWEQAAEREQATLSEWMRRACNAEAARTR